MSSSVPANPTVLDATVLSNFAFLDKVSLLNHLTRPVTPVAVREEISDGVETYPFLQNAMDAFSEAIPVVLLDANAESLSAQFADRLGSGEAAALAIAEAHGGLLASDDRLARSLARDRGVGLTGTIGVLVMPVESGEIDEATGDAWLKRLIDESDYWAPARDISEFR